MTDHAEFSPSSAYRWTECHGSIVAARNLPVSPSSQAADDGTLMHTVSAEVLEGNLGAWTLLQEDKHVEIVREYLEFVEATVAEMKEEDPLTTVIIEKKVHAEDISAYYYGTADVIVFSPKTGMLRVIDLKTGHHAVKTRYRDGRINSQLGSYVLLVLATMGAPVTQFGAFPEAIGVKRIRLTIVQPKVYAHPQTTVVDLDEIDEFARWISVHIDEIEGGDETRTAGDWCGFCPAVGVCETKRQLALEKAQVGFGNVPFSQWAAVLAEAESIAQHLKGIKARAFEALSAGKAIPGLKLIGTLGNRRWVDFERMVVPALRGKLDTRDLYKATPQSPAQIEKLLKAKGVTLNVTPLTDRKPGVKVALESDPGEAVIVKAGDVFKLEGED